MAAEAPVLGSPRPSPGLAAASATTTHIRGSSLLLVGRAISLLANFGIQLLIVRHFSKSDFGAFAYALSVVALLATVVTLGLDRAITRFVAIYDEQEAYGKLLGTIVLQVGAILSLGLGAVALTFGLKGWLAGAVINDRQAISLLLIMIVLGPVQALDEMIGALFAVFVRPRAIFFRRNILDPGLRLAVVLVLLIGDHGIRFLAGGYVAASGAGMLLYGGLLLQAMHRRGVLRKGRAGGLDYPVREIAAYALPLLSSDLVYMLMGTAAAIVLGHYRGTEDVAAFRAVVPVAGMCQVVMSSFSLLFTPVSSRLFARNDTIGIRDLYWRTGAWTAALTFPIFAVTFSLAGPVTTTLFGHRYADSAGFLAILALGQYFQAALGFNGLTLKVFARLRYLVVINLVVAAVNLGLYLVLIPRYGAMGAALATTVTVVLHNVLKQAGLRAVGIDIFERRYVRLYAGITGLAVGLFTVQQLLAPPLPVGLVLVGAASVVLLVLSRRELDITETFPELLRMPVVRHLGRLLAPSPVGLR